MQVQLNFPGMNLQRVGEVEGIPCYYFSLSDRVEPKEDNSEAVGVSKTIGHGRASFSVTFPNILNRRTREPLVMTWVAQTVEDLQAIRRIDQGDNLLVTLSKYNRGTEPLKYVIVGFNDPRIPLKPFGAQAAPAPITDRPWNQVGADWGAVDARMDGARAGRRNGQMDAMLFAELITPPAAAPRARARRTNRLDIGDMVFIPDDIHF